MCQTSHLVVLLEISPRTHFFLKTFNSDFQEIKVWFTDQNGKSLVLEDKINLTLIIKWYGYLKNALFKLA